MHCSPRRARATLVGIGGIAATLLGCGVLARTDARGASAVLAPPGSGEVGRAASGRDETRVLASRREVRVVFPRETARAWGWSASTAPGYGPEYLWSVGIDGIDGFERIVLRVGRRDGEPRAFPSLEQLVAAGRAARCTGGMIATCVDSGVAATVDGGHVVLVLRDSARIAALFGLRPASVRAVRLAPDEPYDFHGAGVRVEYVEPRIPEPDAAFRAEAARRRRAHEAKINWIQRSIRSDGAQAAGTLWLALGDSAEVHVQELRCQYDACIGGHDVASETGWQVADSEIVRLTVPSVEGTLRILIRDGIRARVVARRPGRTTLRVGDLRGPADTMPSHTPVPRELSLAVVVTPPIDRVEFGAHPDTVQLYAGVLMPIRVVDRAGREHVGVPVSVAGVGPNGRASAAAGATAANLTLWGEPGRRMLIASFGGRADTTYVQVIARPER